MILCCNILSGTWTWRKPGYLCKLVPVGLATPLHATPATHGNHLIDFHSCTDSQKLCIVIISVHDIGTLLLPVTVASFCNQMNCTHRLIVLTKPFFAWCL